LFNRLTGAEFEEIPVSLHEFVTSPDFLGEKGLSQYQYELASRMSQIYRKDTLVSLFSGDEIRAEDRFAQTCKEIVMQLGKGSGKDFTSTIAVAYVVYLLMCLKDPAEYYGNSSGDSIDIINIAINADQAQRVFFDNFIKKIKKCPWFDGKYEDKAGAVKFDKNINVYSGHSEREAFEGYNTFMVILDEISGFAEAPDDEEEDLTDQMKKTSKAIYKMYRGSVTSRFPDYGKLVLLSFPRHKDDFIQQKYNALIAEKETIMRSCVLKRDRNLPDGIDGNEITVEWEEDHIIRYARPNVFALRRPSWEVNPNRSIEDYTDDFFDDMGDALGRFACMPSNVTRGFFKNMEKAEETFSRTNGVDGDGIFHPNFQPKTDETMYFLHVDLAQKHDKCAVAMAHVDKWVEYKIIGSEMVEYLPLVVVDAIRWWTPTKTQTVDFKSVVEYIKAVRRRGFYVKLVTFDRWNSYDTMQDLERVGIDTENLSVAKKHYDDWLVTMYDSRLVGPHEETLLTEMRELQEKKGKVDHPRKGNKDLCDAVAGAIFDAVSHTPKEEMLQADALTLSDLNKMVNEQEEEAKKRKWDRDNVIVAPKVNPNDAPADIRDLLESLRIL
jgi:hypothetical protein